MTQDESEVRAVIASWMEATKSGDIPQVLSRMTDDAIFLVAGKTPMDKAAFEATSRAQASAKMKIEATSEVKEVQVEGNLAYAWTQLTVSMHQPGQTEPMRRSGPTLTVFKKVGGRWLLHRDANLLSES
jgi:uncharacterized protein (TIGR02246 family)